MNCNHGHMHWKSGKKGTGKEKEKGNCLGKTAVESMYM